MIQDKIMPPSTIEEFLVAYHRYWHVDAEPTKSLSPERCNTMSIHPALESVGHLFGTNLIFRVPRYQRYYAWDAEQIGDFLTDLDLCLKARVAGTPREHFFGGLVTVRTNVDGSSRQNMEVIDGQQRLASFSMLAAQLRNSALQLAESIDITVPDNPKAFLVAFAKTLKAKFERYEDKIKLQVVEIDRLELSKPDLVFFKDLIEGRNPTASRTSHKLLKQAWDRIGAKLTPASRRRADGRREGRSPVASRHGDGGRLDPHSYDHRLESGGLSAISRLERSRDRAH